MRKINTILKSKVKNVKNYVFYKLVFIFLMFLLVNTKINSQCTPNSGEVQGTIYNDVNFNSIIDIADNVLQNIKVYAYDEHQLLVAETTSGIDGQYFLTGLTDGTAYRIEYGIPTDYYLATNNKTIKNIVSPSCNSDLLLHRPIDYTHDNPKLGISMFLQGTPSQYANRSVLVSLDADFTTNSSHEAIAKKADLGATWGLVFKKTTQQLFSSAFIKQYAGLGPNGMGAIYVTSRDINGWSSTLFIDLIAHGVDLGTMTTTDFQDCDYGAQVGKIGLGSLALSADENYLYTINMYKNELVIIPTDKTKFNEIEEIQIPNPGCVGGNMHSFALKSYNGKVYVGVTCGAENIRKEEFSTVHVYEFDPLNKSFNQIFTTNYNRGFLYDVPTNKVEVQHWLTDIDFTDENNMIIVLNDRVGHRYCLGTNGRLDTQNGDILMVWNDNGVWKLEENGVAGIYSGTGVGDNEGPGGGEFFGEDSWPSNKGLHPETATGSSLVLEGTGEVIVPVYDPEKSAYSGGLKRFNTSDGSQTSVYSIYTHTTFPQMGKASGFGDIDAIYNPLPLEIGDFVWSDTDNDGIQDPEEKGIAGLNISLFDENCNEVGTTTTDLDGYYVFNNTNVDLNGDAIMDNLDVLKKYYVVLNDSKFANDQLNISNEVYFLTVLNKGVGVNKDENDNDAQVARNICNQFNGKPYIEVETESSGQNKYDADFGFSLIKIFDLALRKTPVSEATVHYGDVVEFKISVFNQGTVDAHEIMVSDYINSGYEVNPLLNPDWDFSGNFPTYTHIPVLKPGERFDVFIKMKVKPNSSIDEFVNYAEITSALDPDGNPGDDIDSYADDIEGNDIGGIPNLNGNNTILVTDDLIDDDGTFDEDDHDPAVINILDLALQKKVAGNESIFKVGDTVKFIFNVYNQGNVVASSYKIVDYLSNDFIFEPSLNPEWIMINDSILSLSVDEELPPFAKKQLEITLIIDKDAEVDELLNYGEISDIKTYNEDNPKDYDSVPNSIEGDDEGGKPGTSTDDQIFWSPMSEPSADEDDQDVASIKIINFDLAIVKKALNHNIYEGQTATFEIEVFNQGTITADRISLVDYLDTGFVLDDSKWQYYNGDNTKADIILSVANGYLPPVGLLPGKSVKVYITLLLETAPVNIDYLTNEVEIKSSYDISGNNFGIFDKDSTPDDDKENDMHGADNQLDGDGTDDEDDHDWATIFVKSHIIIDPCICLNNATDETNGQFRINISITSPSGQNWEIDSIYRFYDLAGPVPPDDPVEYALGTTLTESVDDPKPGLSIYSIEGIQVSNISYYVRFVNNLGDTKFIDLASGACIYENTKISGPTGTCANNIEQYTIDNPNADANYNWTLPKGGGTFIGSNVGTSVTINWGNVNGIYDLSIEDTGGMACISPKLLHVKVGNSSGALAMDDYIISSADTNCELEVTPEVVLSTPVDPSIPFEITLIDPDGNVLPSNIITWEYIGMDIMVKIKDQCSGQNGFTFIKVVDKLKPEFDCKDAIVECDLMTEYPGPKVFDNCDANPEVMIISEDVNYQDCTSKYTKIITREYLAVDKGNNVSDTCIQNISIKRFNKTDVVFPDDYLISNNTALTCNAYQVDEDGNPHFSVTGTPLYHGKDIYTICTNNFCEISVGYTDYVAKDDGCVKTIYRTWHVIENCEEITLANIISHVQTIEIYDLTPPLPVAPDNIIATTDGLNCSAKVQLPKLEITDNCSTEFDVNLIYPGGMMEHSNGGEVTLPLGTHKIIYMVYDQCGNLAEVEMTVNVVDNTPPVAVCQTNTVVALSNNGEADVPAMSFDSGSYDDCGVAELEVKRMFNGTFGPTVHFDCNDLDSTDIMVVLRATDSHNNWNQCMVSINVQHKYPPQISCPNDMKVECDFAYDTDSLSKFFGTAIAIDVCGYTIIEEDPLVDLNSCGIGSITRHFVVTGRGGIQKECSQTISFDNSHPFLLSDITWPKQESSTNICGTNDLSPDDFGRPILNEDQCDIVSMNYSDQIFYGVQDEACYTIVRSWTVMDECQKVNNEFKKWHFDQIIHVNNEIDPFIEPLVDIDTCTFDSLCNSGYVELEAIGTDDCTDPDDLQWTYQIDLFTDGIIDTTAHQVGGKAVASGEYPIGTHKILWIVEDRCGNSFARTQSFTIKNCTQPIAICLDALVVELSPTLVDGDTTATAQILAEAFNRASYHPCGYPLTFSYSLDQNDTIRYLDCSWLQTQAHDITLYVTDIFGNVDYCTTHMYVQDNFYICNPFDRCISYPSDSVVIETCNPNLDPGDGILDSLKVDASCGCTEYDVIYSDVDISDNTNTCKKIERSWSVDFNCPDLDTTIVFVQTITIKNDEVPELTCPANIFVDASLNCDTYVNIPVPTFVYGGCNTGLIITNNSLYADSPGENASGTYPEGTTLVQFTLTDDCDNSKSCNVAIEVTDFIDPVCVSNDTIVALDINGQITIDGDFVASASTDNCGILSIDVAPNSFGCNDLNENTVTITVTDTNNNQSVCTATVNIIDTLTQLCNAKDTILYLDENGLGVLNPENIYAGGGGCGGSNDVTLTANPVNFSCSNLGSNTVELIVTDNITGINDTCDAIVTVKDTIAPECLVQETTLYVDENGNTSLVFDDIDNGSSDQCGTISNVSLSHVAFDCSDVGITIEVTVTLTDPSNNVSTCMAGVTVLDTISPVCEAIDTLFVVLDANGMATITGGMVASNSTDNCGATTQSVSPNEFDCNDIGSNDVNIIVSDNSNNQTFCTSIVVVSDTLTQLCNAKDTILYLDENGLGVLDPENIYSGSGGCGGSNDVTLTADPVDFSCTNLGSNTVELIVTDNATGESDTCDAIVTVLDTIAPECLVTETDIFVDEDGNAILEFIDIDNGSSDQCGTISNVSLSQSAFDCSFAGITSEVIVTLTDPSNNESTCTADVTVLDTISPVCEAIDTLFIALDADGMATITGEMIASNSTDNCDTTTQNVSPNTFSCADVGPNTVNITVIDNSNNQTLCTSVVVVSDTLTELCVAHDTIFYLDENGFGVLDPNDIYNGTGGCGNSNDITLIAEPDTFDCDNIGEVDVQLIVIDNVTGNSDTCDAIVSVIDTIAPQCLVQNIDVYLDENGQASFGFEDLNNGSFDPCGEIVDTTLSDISFGCEQIGQAQVVTITLTDNSNNISVCTSEVSVLDTLAPDCQAVDTLIISLDATGMAVITGQNVDNGSSDQCAFISLEVNPDTFYCNDVGIPIEYILTVSDGSGNSSECSGIALVQDTIPPTIICPNDTSVSCTDLVEEEFYVDEYGEPLIFDNCSQGGDYTETVISNFDNCGAGVITRNFTTSDPSGNSAMCTQLITVTSFDNFGEEHITWPEDTITVDNCFSTDPDSINSFPIIDYSDSECSDITVDYDDTNLTPGGDCNDTIQRIWTVVDSCQFDISSGAGTYIFNQTILVFDTLAPLIFGPLDTVRKVLYTEDECSDVLIELPGSVVDCHPNTVIVTNDSPYAYNSNSADATGEYPAGEWDITITATDECGNTATYTFHLEVAFPWYCIKGTFEITEDLSVTVNVADLVSTLPGCANMSFSNTNPDLDSLIFYCPDLGDHPKTIFKFNEFGDLIDSCTTIITITDPNEFCSGNVIAGIQGHVITELNYPIENTEIILSGNENSDILTNVSGQFEFTPLISNGNYKVKPYKNDDVLNGVNTLDIIKIQKHILNIKNLNSPYKLLAADIDNNTQISAADILQLRRVILGEIDEFKNNDSWKFVTANYNFENESNPLIESYPQELLADNLNHKLKVDFVGVKIGDLNNSALANTQMSIESRNVETMSIYTEDKVIRKGNIIDVPFSLATEEEFAAMQFTITFDVESLEFIDFENEELSLSKNNFGLKNIKNGILTFSWNEINNIKLDENDKLFVLKFKVKKSGVLNNQIDFNSDITQKAVFGEDDIMKNIHLEYRNGNQAEFVLYQNEPNPWSFNTNFKFELPQSGKVNIKITNSFGVLIDEFTVFGNKGFNSIQLNKNKINYSGLLFVDFEFSGKHQVKKMIKLK